MRKMNHINPMPGQHLHEIKGYDGRTHDGLPEIRQKLQHLAQLPPIKDPNFLAVGSAVRKAFPKKGGAMDRPDRLH